MNTLHTMNGFPTGAEPGSRAWTSFWDDESVGVTPGTRITQEDLMPAQGQDFETTRCHVIGAVSVEAWFDEAIQQIDPPLY